MSALNATHDFLGPGVLVCRGEVVKGERNRKQTRRHRKIRERERQHFHVKPYEILSCCVGRTFSKHAPQGSLACVTEQHRVQTAATHTHTHTHTCTQWDWKSKGSQTACQGMSRLKEKHSSRSEQKQTSHCRVSAEVWWHTPKEGCASFLT